MGYPHFPMVVNFHGLHDSCRGRQLRRTLLQEIPFESFRWFLPRRKHRDFPDVHSGFHRFVFMSLEFLISQIGFYTDVHSRSCWWIVVAMSVVVHWNHLKPIQLYIEMPQIKLWNPEERYQSLNDFYRLSVKVLFSNLFSDAFLDFATAGSTP